MMMMMMHEVMLQMMMKVIECVQLSMLHQSYAPDDDDEGDDAVD